MAEYTAWIEEYLACFPLPQKAPKGKRREQRRRLNARFEYAAAIERWADDCPSVVKFWAIKKWLKAMPKKEDFYG